MRYVFALAVVIVSFTAQADDQVVARSADEPAQEAQVSRDVASVDVDAALKEIQTDIEKADAVDVSADSE